MPHTHTHMHTRYNMFWLKYMWLYVTSAETQDWLIVLSWVACTCVNSPPKMQLWTAGKPFNATIYIQGGHAHLICKGVASLHLVARPHSGQKLDWLLNFNNNLQIKRTNFTCALIMYRAPYILDIWIRRLKVGFYCYWLLLLQSQASCGVSGIFFKMREVD